MANVLTQLVGISTKVAAQASTAIQNVRISTVRDMTGAAVDLSSWNALLLTVFATGPTNMAGHNFIGSVSGTGNADGSCDFAIDASVLFTSLLPFGTYQVQFVGKETSGDDYEVLGLGTLTYSIS